MKLLRRHGSRWTRRRRAGHRLHREMDSPAGSDGPMLGLIMEYDALRGTQGAFHGDQHTPRARGAAAALALKEYFESAKLKGACGFTARLPRKWPARQEHHARCGRSSRARRSWCGVTPRARAVPRRVRHLLPQHQRGEIRLYRPAVAPASSWNGRNALEAAGTLRRCGWTAIEYPARGLDPGRDSRVVAPNVVPDRAVVDYYVRYPTASTSSTSRR
jgi:metal-dependent amidase/aminoacylase/carboxypeptidase family protein